MKNNLLLIWVMVVVVSIGVSVFITYLFIIPKIEKNKYTPIEIYTYGINSNDYNKIINDSIEENINKMYDRHISHLNISITLFSVCLGIFTIIFGAFYIIKINEIQKEINNIKNLPEEVFSKFYKQKLKDDINNLLSEDSIKRNFAIKGLNNNTEITIKDFNLLKQVFEIEISSNINTFTYNNIYILLTILIRLDNKKTVELLVDFLNSNEFNQIKMLNILQFLFLDKENELVKKYIKKSLLSDNITLYPYILNTIINNGMIEEYITFIIENCSENVISCVINYMYSYKLVIKDFTKLLLNRKNIENENNIINPIFSNDNISNSDKIELLLTVYHKNKDRNEIILYNYLFNIKGNIQFKNEFKSIYYKKFADKLSLNEFFEKYKNLNKDNFV